MYLHSDVKLTCFTTRELHEQLNKRIQIPENSSREQLRRKLCEAERTCTIAIWHDHTTCLGQGYILVTAKVLYDPAVFIDSKDLPRTSPIRSLQSYIEEPEIHILALSTSSIEDQAGLIPDRKSCLSSLDNELTSSEGVPVKDRLVFFYGDKPAVQFERGSQQGGDFPCTTCGCMASRMDDLTHCFTWKWKSVEDLQCRATKGKCIYMYMYVDSTTQVIYTLKLLSYMYVGRAGKQPGVVKPFDALTVDQIKEELRSRDIYTSASNKSDLSRDLKKALRGVQRVPSLLLQNPTQPLSELHLQHYQILDCEPLHDIKGHIQNVIQELPGLLDQSTRTKLNKLLTVDLHKEKKTGSDYRLLIIHILTLLNKNKAPKKMCQLFKTLVTISHLLYSDDNKRTPKAILRLYNST